MAARARGRANIKAVLGPTNTGKTHLAIERMLGHASGMIGLPLRLLAREVYDRVVKAKGETVAALITGEEKIVPETAKYFVCTVEAMPQDRAVEFVAIDEIQVARDLDRGHVFTDRILNARGFGETMLLGADTMRPMVRKLLPDAEITRRERMSTLKYVGARKITKLPKRSAVVVFSAEEVYAIAELLRRHRGGAAVVMGALSPRTRNAQVALYQSGEVDFLVATDAIGMGLNMDVDHVAFASRRKFDGHSWRDLRPDEIAQIAGRAGRFTRDGDFGETGECEPFDEEIVERVENHEFETIEAVQWRSDTLNFSTVPALIASLETPPSQPGLLRVRGADDEMVLRRLADDLDMMDHVRGPDDVRRLWEACQLPDFRKLSKDEHTQLAARIAGYIVVKKGRVPSTWIAAELDKLDRAEGDLDALQARLAQVRTWTYAASRSDWLEDADEWRMRTRAVEDKLSDALHEALTQRFIDRRTSALLKGLKREDALLAGVSEEGEVTVEGHFVGQLEGLEFRPDPRANGLEGRALRNAALRALRPEVSRRLARIAAAADADISLGRDGRVCVDGAAVARLAPGQPVLKPRLVMIGADTAGGVERNAAHERLELWLAQTVAADLRPLVALETAWREGRLPANARGLAFRLIENAGALDRVTEDIEIDAEAEAVLKRYGVRVGRHSVFMPQLVRPRAAATLAVLWHFAHPGKTQSVFLARPGALSVPLERPRSWGECAAAGFRACGHVAVRLDLVERLAESIEQQPDQLEPMLARIIGRPARELGGVLMALGYHKAPPVEGAPSQWRHALRRRKRKPQSAQPDNAFAELANLLPPSEAPPRRRRSKTA
ncbi:helicase-related protein [Terricaulis silvestris]|uniref:Superfamily II RNA helicase n=1 Tax=Terricaulis silvestris TaxID=2686094 RepID=A0A6I6MQ10_9CAUL|nr:helicase-related protein [Terricaulis silvestris]QGZ93233.1 Superfamily II RNA helicase [Terricaulis silvestris]